MPLFLVIFVLTCTFSSLSEADHGKKHPSAVVVGTVYCDTCFQNDFSKNSHFISGASVAVECVDGNSNPSFRKQVRTDSRGEFQVHLPFTVSKHVKKIKGCSVKLIRSSEPYCAVASTATSSSVHLKSRKEGIHIFSAGFFTFKPHKQPDLCNQKPSVKDSQKLTSQKSSIPTRSDPAFPPPLRDPTTPEPSPLPLIPNLPPMPQLPPLPPLPGLPNLPGVPNLPPTPGNQKVKKAAISSKTEKLADKKKLHPETFIPIPGIPLPPNPLLPPPILPPNPLVPSPPSLIPPNPLLPPPILPPNPLVPSPPSIIPPNPFQPSPLPFLPLPPIPGLTPPPSPPSLPIPLPPLPPLPPIIPGVPPASSSQKKASP